MNDTRTQAVSTTTLSALFLRKADSKKALAALEKVGIPPEDVAIGDATVIEREEVDVKEGRLRRLFSRQHDVPEQHQTRYEDHVRKGAIALAVAVPEGRVGEVVDILNYHGAKDFEGEHLDSLQKPAVDEHPDIGRRSERRGGVRVYSALSSVQNPTPAPRG